MDNWTLSWRRRRARTCYPNPVLEACGVLNRLRNRLPNLYRLLDDDLGARVVTPRLWSETAVAVWPPRMPAASRRWRLTRRDGEPARSSRGPCLRRRHGKRNKLCRRRKPRRSTTSHLPAGDDGVLRCPCSLPCSLRDPEDVHVRAVSRAQRLKCRQVAFCVKLGGFWAHSRLSGIDNALILLSSSDFLLSRLGILLLHLLHARNRPVRREKTRAVSRLQVIVSTVRIRAPGLHTAPVDEVRT